MTMTADEVVRNFYEGYNDRDLDRTYEQYVSHDLINHAFGGAYDRAGWLAADQGLLAAFTDLHVEVLDQIVQGDRVATRLSLIHICSRHPCRASSWARSAWPGTASTVSGTASSGTAGLNVVRNSLSPGSRAGVPGRSVCRCGSFG